MTSELLPCYKKMMLTHIFTHDMVWSRRYAFENACGLRKPRTTKLESHTMKYIDPLVGTDDSNIHAVPGMTPDLVRAKRQLAQCIARDNLGVSDPPVVPHPDWQKNVLPKTPTQKSSIGIFRLLSDPPKQKRDAPAKVTPAPQFQVVGKKIKPVPSSLPRIIAFSTGGGMGSRYGCRHS